MFKLSLALIVLCLNVVVHCQSYRSYLVAGPSTPAFIAQQGSPVANGILLYEITWNTSQSGSAHTMLPTAGKPTFGDITIIKTIDANTNTMLSAVASGKLIAGLYLYTYLVGSPSTKFYTIELQKVIVTSCNLDIVANQETITLNFARVITTFGQTTTPSNGNPFSWNIPAGAIL